MNTNRDEKIKETVREFYELFNDFIGDIEFDDTFKHLAVNKDDPVVIDDIARWLRITLTQVRQEAYEKGYADGYMSGNEAVTEACQEERARVCEEISDYVKREMPSDFNAVMLINHVTHIQEGLKNNK